MGRHRDGDRAPARLPHGRLIDLRRQRAGRVVLDPGGDFRGFGRTRRRANGTFVDIEQPAGVVKDRIVGRRSAGPLRVDAPVSARVEARGVQRSFCRARRATRRLPAQRQRWDRRQRSCRRTRRRLPGLLRRPRTVFRAPSGLGRRRSPRARSRRQSFPNATVAGQSSARCSAG